MIASYQKKETVTQLKKTYSILQQAIKRAEVDNDFMDNWDFTLSADEFNNKYIKPYLQVVREYDRDNFPSEIHNIGINGDTVDGYAGFKTNPKLILSDGAMLTIDKNSLSINILIDINGLRKPNRYGRDVFAFLIQPKKGIMPYTVVSSLDDDFTREELLGSGHPKYCSRNSHGLFCSAVIMMDGWEIKDDYPW